MDSAKAIAYGVANDVSLEVSICIRSVFQRQLLLVSFLLSQGTGFQATSDSSVAGYYWPMDDVLKRSYHQSGRPCCHVNPELALCKRLSNASTGTQVS